MRMRFVLYLVAGYAVLVTIAFFFAEKLLFFPHRELWGTPSERGLPWEDVRFEAADGTPLHGWYVPGAGRGPGGAVKATVLFCPGHAGNISHRIDSLAIFHRLGVSTFIFDYRGYGESEGTPSEQGVYSDVEGAWNWLTKHRGVPPERIVLFGRSLGGAVAAYAGEKFTPRGLILESTFTSLASIGQGHYFFLPVKLIVGNAFDTLSRLEKISCPILLASSPEDEVVPGRHGKMLFEAAREPKWFLPLKGDHNLGFMTTGQAYVDGLDAFFRNVLGE